jgi:hypothetical protein
LQGFGLPTLKSRDAFQSKEVGVRIILKFTHLVLAGVLSAAVFSAAQSAPQNQSPDAGTAPAHPMATGQSPDQAPSSSQPSASQPAKPADQTQSKDATSSSDPNKDKHKAKAPADKTAQTSNDRLFFALPNFLTVDKNGNIIPLTAGQKFKVVARGAFDPVQIPWYAILSGISQAENSEPGYGQGWEGYGKRFGAYAADGTIENFFVGAILPSIFRQDPRFFPSGKGSFAHRAGYAVSRIVITRGDNGQKEFNISETLGSAMSATISTYSYHPRADRTIGNTASVWVSQMGYDAITIMLKEFWPDIRRKIKKQPAPQTVAAPASGQ